MHDAQQAMAVSPPRSLSDLGIVGCEMASARQAPRSLSDLGIVGCETASAVHFLPAFCPIVELWACKSGKNCPRWGRFSLLTPQARQAPSTASSTAQAFLSRSPESCHCRRQTAPRSTSTLRVVPVSPAPLPAPHPHPHRTAPHRTVPASDNCDYLIVKIVIRITIAIIAADTIPMLTSTCISLMGLKQPVDAVAGPLPLCRPASHRQGNVAIRCPPPA